MAADNKREQERKALHDAIWAIADELRGAVDGWDFKNYVLGTMFYRYISENLASYIDAGEHAAGNPEFSYAKMNDKDAESAKKDLIQEKGFFIPPSQLFINVLVQSSSKTATFTDAEGETKSVQENLNEYLELIFNNIENSAKGTRSEDSFSGLFDDFDVNSNKLGSTVAKRNERLVKLLQGIAKMELGAVKDHDIDAFGDAYEYLMKMYASNAGKSGGEFYTPQEVSELLTRLGTVGKKKINKVYDPACGSGSLLLKAEQILGKDSVTNGFFGQEINITTYNLCRINMFLHDVGYDKFSIACEDTLINPSEEHYDEEPFELIVSNPPYSIKWEGDDNPLLINDPRFAPAGVLAPKSKADLAFIMHSLSWLATNGTAAIVCFPGIMYRGGSERTIRQYLIDNNFVDAIILLPENLFYGTTIATCIMVLKKGKHNNSVLFINASNEYAKEKNNNRLTDKNIKRIVDVFTSGKEVEFFSRSVEYEEIKKQGYDLSVTTYVEEKDTREKVDIDELEDEIKEITDREKKLREAINKIISNHRDVGLRGLMEELCPGKVEEVPLWTVTIWDKKFTAVEKYKQPVVENYNYLLAKDLFAMEVENGDVFLLSTGEQTGWTSEGVAGQYMKEGEVVTIPWGKSRAVTDCIKYYKGKFVTADNRIATSNDTNRLLNRYLYYWMMSKGEMIDSFYRGSGIKHPDMAKVLDLIIPLPPRDVQEKIIGILDEFTRLADELNETLSSELIARKKQYEYYRNGLVTFAKQ